MYHTSFSLCKDRRMSKGDKYRALSVPYAKFPFQTTNDILGFKVLTSRKEFRYDRNFLSL